MKKVLIGMSGGVDSSVAAYVLKKQGYKVIGVTLSLYNEDPESGKTADERDAASVCKKIGIEHIVVDKRVEFKQKVIDYFVSAYEQGLTPNPCIVCNKAVKFSEMLSLADTMGADYIATGHYSSIKYNKETGEYLLYRPKDKSKDQTYMLYKLGQKELSRILMPLASYKKEEIRTIAREIGLSVADRPDSQDICFVKDGDYASFISQYTCKSFPEGDYISTDGKVLGKHKGMIHYTVGQRKGLGIALGKPAFVIEKQASSNKVIISQDENMLFKDRVELKDINFISEKSETETRVFAKLRYRHKESSALLKMTGNTTGVLIFDTPQRAPAPGQSAVFYKEDLVIGGGTIV